MIHAVSVPHDRGPDRGLGGRRRIVRGPPKVLETEHAKALTIDTRPGVAYQDVAGVVAAARELDIPVRFVGHERDK